MRRPHSGEPKGQTGERSLCTSRLERMPPMWINELGGVWPKPLQARKAPVCWLLIHRVGGPAFSYDIESLISQSLDYWTGLLAYSYLVDRRGWVFRLVDDHIVTPHAYRRNHESIGVGFIGDFRQEEPTTPQLAGGLQLFTWLLRRYPKAVIAGHTDVPGATRTRAKKCPGHLFDLEGFRARAREEAERIGSETSKARG